MKRLTILEYDNGFVMPLKQVAIAQGNGAFLKEEIKMMIGDLPEDEEVEVVIVKLDRTTTAKEYFDK